MKSYSYIANWKMMRPFAQGISWAKEHAQDLLKLKNNHNCSLVICVSNQTIYAIKEQLQNSGVELAAQDCSEFNLGAYTGQSSALSLGQSGASHCMVGHSEARAYFHQTNEMVCNKLAQVVQNSLTPIVCFGDTAQQHQDGKTLHAITEQLTPLLQTIAKHGQQKSIAYIAYEPVWAIGSGKIPTGQELNQIFTHIADLCKRIIPNISYKLVYGGSVNPETIKDLKAVALLDGFLIGSASLDFQKLENIVSCTL